MPRKLFGLIGGVTAAAASADEALLRQIAQQRDSNPLIGAKIGGREITQQLFTKMNSERGFHIESMLCALGALAGHACQASIRARNVARGVPEMTDLVAVDTPDDRRYFFGDAINHPLSEAQYSIRKPVAGQHSSRLVASCRMSAKSSGMPPKPSAPKPPASSACRRNTFPTASRTTTCAHCGRNCCRASGASALNRDTGPYYSVSRFKKSSIRVNRYSIPASPRA